MLSALATCALALGAQTDIDGVAQRVLELCSENRRDELQALAVTEPDPWIVADHLLRRGHRGAAAALAEAAPEIVREPLLGYLESELPRCTAEEAALGELTTARTGKELGAVLETLEKLPPVASPVLRVRIANTIGDLRRRAKDSEASVAAYERAALEARELGWVAGEARALRELGLSARRLANGLERAITAWSRACELEWELGESPNLALTQFYFGNALGESGRLQRSRAILESSRDLFKAQGDRAKESWAERSLGFVHERLGHLGVALEAYESARLLAEDRPWIAAIDLDLAEVHGRLDDTDRSMLLANRALAVFDELQDWWRMAQARGTLGLAHARRGDHDRALVHFQTAQELFKKVRDNQGLCTSLANTALAEMQAGLLTRAENTQRRGLSLAIDLDFSWQEANANFHLGRILRRKGAYEEARVCDEALLRIGNELQSDRLLMRGHLNTAKRMLDQEEYGAALSATIRAIEHTERTITGLAPQEDASARDHRADLFATGIHAAMGAEDASALFEMIERGRARALVESLGGRDQLEEILVPEELVQRHQQAEENELESLLQLRAAASDEDKRTAREALEKARAQTRQTVERIQRGARGGADVAFQEPPELSEVQKTLAADEALVLYVMLETEATALVVTPKTSRITQLGLTATISDRCDLLQSESRNTRGVSPAKIEAAKAAVVDTADLYRLLIEPLGLPDSTRRLLIAPDGPLAYVPFSLVAPELEMVYVPSGTTYHLLASQDAPRGTGVLAVGDPDYSQRSDLSSLPGSRAEVLGIGDQRLLAENANVEGLLAHLARDERWRSVHLACHARVDPDEPLENELVLTPSEKDDGRLTLLDVLGLSVDSDLVVLSACQTGVGKIYRTEGVFGFTRAFLTAGAPRVIVSLWRVDDTATQALMTRLYELWNPAEGEGLPLATALREAQGWVSDQPGWSEPHYWAAWQLWGLAE